MDIDLLKRRIYDTADLCEKNNRPHFLGFLSMEQVRLADCLLKNRNVKYDFFGGFDKAQRKLLGCFPDWCTDYRFPITSITAEFRKADTLSHRDALGTLMALGLKRETVGDILIDEGRAVMFLTEDTADYALSQITKIGRVGVTLTKGCIEPLPQGDKKEEHSITVASQRLDCVVSAIVGESRGRSSERINQSLVTVNSVVAQKVTQAVLAGDVISVRSKGRFVILSIDRKTRKNRIVLKYERYV